MGSEVLKTPGPLVRSIPRLQVTVPPATAATASHCRTQQQRRWALQQQRTEQLSSSSQPLQHQQPLHLHSPQPQSQQPQHQQRQQPPSQQRHQQQQQQSNQHPPLPLRHTHAVGGQHQPTFGLDSQPDTQPAPPRTATVTDELDTQPFALSPSLACSRQPSPVLDLLQPSSPMTGIAAQLSLEEPTSLEPQPLASPPPPLHEPSFSCVQPLLSSAGLTSSLPPRVGVNALQQRDPGVLTQSLLQSVRVPRTPAAMAEVSPQGGQAAAISLPTTGLTSPIPSVATAASSGPPSSTSLPPWLTSTTLRRMNAQHWADHEDLTGAHSPHHSWGLQEDDSAMLKDQDIMDWLSVLRDHHAFALRHDSDSPITEAHYKTGVFCTNTFFFPLLEARGPQRLYMSES